MTTRGMMRTMLEREGWQVTEAANGREGLERVAAVRAERHPAGPHDAGDGRFRVHGGAATRSRSGGNIPVVVITAKELTADDRARLNGSVQKVLLKGAFSREVLLNKLRELVSACIS